MKQEDLFRKLGLILNELNEQYQFLAENPQQLNELELELFHANANFLADHIQIIKKVNLNQQPPLILAQVKEEPIVSSTPLENNDVQEESQVETITFSGQDKEPEDAIESFTEEEPTPALNEIETEIFKLDQSPSTFEFILNDHAEHETLPQANPNEYAHDSFNTEEKFEFEEKSVDELFNRPLSEEEEQILAEKIQLREKQATEVDPEEDEIGPEPFLVAPKEEFPIKREDMELEVAPIAETKVNTQEPVEDPTYKPTLNELLAKGRIENLNATAGTGVQDLKQAINLNDKLLYIKDLFNGYNLAYAEAIEIANKLPNFEAADNFFQKNYASKNNWADKQATVDKFYQLLNQRFKG
jgi:hypothetical protein